MDFGHRFGGDNYSDNSYSSNSYSSATVYITKTGSKYHRAGCVSLRRSSIEIDRDQAIARGYDACKICRP